MQPRFFGLHGVSWGQDATQHFLPHGGTAPHHLLPSPSPFSSLFNCAVTFYLGDSATPMVFPRSFPGENPKLDLGVIAIITLWLPPSSEMRQPKRRAVIFAVKKKQHQKQQINWEIILEVPKARGSGAGMQIRQCRLSKVLGLTLKILTQMRETWSEGGELLMGSRDYHIWQMETVWEHFAEWHLHRAWLASLNFRASDVEYQHTNSDVAIKSVL